MEENIETNDNVEWFTKLELEDMIKNGITFDCNGCTSIEQEEMLKMLGLCVQGAIGSQ